MAGSAAHAPGAGSGAVLPGSAPPEAGGLGAAPPRDAAGASGTALPGPAPHVPPPDRQLLRARLFLRAALPVLKVIVEDDQAMNRRFTGVHAVVQFRVKDGAGTPGTAPGGFAGPEPFTPAAQGTGGRAAPGRPHGTPAASTADPTGAQPLAAHVIIDDGVVRVEPGVYDHGAHGETAKPTITFTFADVYKMNDFFAGKTVLPGIKGLSRPGLLAKVVVLLLALKLLLPSAQPKDADKRRLKVKMTLYMITTALSQYNKAGDPEMVRWTSRQPERIYQMSVEPEGIAAYLRVRAGLSKAGRGFYERRRPFVHLRFHGVDGALAVMNKEVGFVDGVGRGFVTVEGSPEYAANFNDFMQRVQALLLG